MESSEGMFAGRYFCCQCCSYFNFTCTNLTKIMRFSLYLLLVCCFFSCQEKPVEKRSDKIAQAICDCTSQLMNLNKQAASTQDSMDFEGIQAEFEKARTCIAKQKLKAEERPEVGKALALRCPELAAEPELLSELMGR